MVMGSEKGLGFNFRLYVFHHRPGDGHAVVGTGAAAHLVQDDQGIFRGVLQNLGYLVHFHHKGALPRSQVVTGPYPGKDPVHSADIRTPGRNKAAHLGHEHQQGYLPHVCGFARHIRAGDDHHPFVRGI